MTKQQKQQITKNKHDINKMDIAKLCLFIQKLHLVKPIMDKVVFDRTIRATDIQMVNLKEMITVSPMVVISELKIGEL
jgi:hypothetical protein